MMKRVWRRVWGWVGRPVVWVGVVLVGMAGFLRSGWAGDEVRFRCRALGMGVSFDGRLVFGRLSGELYLSRVGWPPSEFESRFYPDAVSAGHTAIGPADHPRMPWGLRDFRFEAGMRPVAWDYSAGSVYSAPVTQRAFRVRWEVPMVWIVGLAVVGMGWRFVVVRGRAPDASLRSAGLCAQCGYDVRATPERCPECGSGVG